MDSRTLPETAGALTALSALLLCTASLAAQTPEQRRTLDAFRDSLQQVTDSSQLQGREAQLLLAARRARNDALLHVRLGQLALRQGELGGGSHYDDAASEFHWAADLAPQWPYAWFGLGLAEYALGERLGDSPAPALRSAASREAWSRASLAFARASVLEPGLAVRLEDLARRALRERQHAKAVVIREALRRAATELAGSRGPRVVLALARVQRETGDSGELHSFETYLASGENTALAEVELGRSQLLAGNLRGMTTYLAPAADDDPLALGEYRADLLPLAGEGQLADFDLSRGPARAAMLRSFWLRRDRLELRQEGERLAEHLRRLLLARREFLVVDADGNERLDDRGRMYIRHGEPDDRASFTLPGVEPNESWRYHRGGGDLVLHFVARQAPSDFRLVESVLDVGTPLIELATGGGAPAGGGLGGGGAELFRSRLALAPLYGQVGPGSRERVSDVLAQERALGRRGIQIASHSDSYPLRFARGLAAWGSLLVAGGSGAQPAIQVVFAIPGYAVEPASGTVGVVYPVRVRFVALDERGELVAAVDTVARLELSEPVPANRSLLGRVAVPVRSGRLLAHAAVQYGDEAGTVFQVDTVAVPSPGGGELALGDLLVGNPRGRLRVPVGDASVALTPGGVVHRSDGAELGLEVFGLEPGARAQLQLLVAPVDSLATEPGAPHWREFPGAAGTATITRAAGSPAIVPWHSSVSLKNLKPGSWLLAAVVTDALGREARRETRLIVLTP